MRDYMRAARRAWENFVMSKEALYVEESELFTITSTIDGTVIAAKHGGSVRIPASAKLHEALVGIGVADAVKFAVRQGVYVATQRATSAAKGATDAVKCAALLKRIACFANDEWTTKGERTKEKILFPILVAALHETVWATKTLEEAQNAVGEWTEKERAAVLDSRPAIRTAYDALIGKPQTVSRERVANLLGEADAL